MGRCGGGQTDFLITLIIELTSRLCMGPQRVMGFIAGCRASAVNYGNY